MKKIMIMVLLALMVCGCSKQTVEVEVNTWSYGSTNFAEQYDASNLLIDDLLAMDYVSYSIVDKFRNVFVDEGMHQFLVLFGLDGEYKKEININVVDGKDTFDNNYEIIVPSSLLNENNAPYKVGDTMYLNMLNTYFDTTIESELEHIKNSKETFLKKYDINIQFEVVGIYEADGSEKVYTSLATCEDITSKMRDSIEPIVLQFYRMTFTIDEDKVVGFKKAVNSLLAHSQFDYGQKLDYQIKERE